MANVLIIGSGAREYAIMRAFQKSAHVTKIFVAPGNDGMCQAGAIQLGIAETDFDALIQAAKQNRIDLTFVGGEIALVAGIVDAFQAAGLAIFGPTKKAAQLEGSKIFMKQFLNDHQIPTAKSSAVSTLKEAFEIVDDQIVPIVIKTDELAFGKGVTIHDTKTDAKHFLKKLFKANPSRKIIIEEYLSGFEYSFFSLVGKNQVVHTPVAHDYKRRFDQDKGPNTGGMGAYSPVKQITQSIIKQTIDTIVMPTLQAMKQEDNPFFGVLYCGVILTENGPKLIEYNVRFGDPETQVVLPQLTSDFYNLITELMSGKHTVPTWQIGKIFAGVVLCDPNYPKPAVEKYELPDFSREVLVDYSNSAQGKGNLSSHGGRVATIVCQGSTSREVYQTVYKAIKNSKTKLGYRHDILKDEINEVKA